jgi:hypothetical protein
MSDMTTQTTDVEVPAAVIDDVARRLDETDTDPEPAAVRDWLCHFIEVSPQFRFDDRPAVDAVRARIDDDG